MATGNPKSKWNSSSLPFKAGPSNNGSEVSLSYEGKRPETEILNIQSAALKKVWQGDVDNSTLANQLYYGDNLPILASLMHNPLLRGNVRMIYIDPPFATQSIFQSRSQNNAYTDLLEGAHYIEFMRERLILLHELLANNGSIYIHLDENMAFHIKIIMDDIFGKKHFRNWITRKKCNPKNYTRKTYGNVADYILFYTKTDDYVWNRPLEEWTDEKALKEYQYIENETGRRYKKVPVHAPGTRNGETGKPWHGMTPPPGKHWQYRPSTLDEMDARGEIYWSPNGNPRRKVYLDASAGIAVQDIWLDYRDAHNQNIEITGYPTEKNPAVLARLIAASSNPGDLILDSFSGSGTTLAIASQLGRSWIGIDNSLEAMKTTLKRFTKGRERMGDFVHDRVLKSQKSQDIQPQMLFPLEEIPIATLSQQKSKIINDFSLYATESGSEELEMVAQQWQQS